MNIFRTPWLVFLLLLNVLPIQKSFAFGPCTSTFPSEMSYLPSVEACGGTAAVVLFGQFRDSFSVVVRDCNNGDRDPCYSSVTSCGTNQSSPFKVQKIVSATIKKGSRVRTAKIHCLKERGDSEIYKIVRRITIKLKNPVTKPSDVAKICLKTRVKAVHAVQILTTGGTKIIGNTGYNSKCATQRYLACDYSYAALCPKY